MVRDLYSLIILSGPGNTNLVSRPITQGQVTFSDLIILLHLTHDYGENELLLVKIAARVLVLWLDTSSEPKWHKCSFYF